MSSSLIPLDIQMYILSYFDVTSILICRRVCRKWNEALNEIRMEKRHFYTAYNTEGDHLNFFQNATSFSGPINHLNLCDKLCSCDLQLNWRDMISRDYGKYDRDPFNTLIFESNRTFFPGNIHLSVTIPARYNGDKNKDGKITFGWNCKGIFSNLPFDEWPGLSHEAYGLGQYHFDEVPINQCGIYLSTSLGGYKIHLQLIDATKNPDILIYTLSDICTVIGEYHLHVPKKYTIYNPYDYEPIIPNDKLYYGDGFIPKGPINTDGRIAYNITVSYY